jgi:protein required for attachment to host cells
MRSLLASDATPEQLRQQHDSIQNLHQQLSDRHIVVAKCSSLSVVATNKSGKNY